jgi:hypothetical protein
MGFGTIIALVIGALGLIFGGFGWRQIKRHGAEKEKRKQLERAFEDVENKLDIASRPPLTANQQLAALIRLRDRARRRW